MLPKTLLSRLVLFFYGILAISLFLYSYTQVDLNLTLSRVSIFQAVEKSFQQVGYFNRPLSTSLYMGLLFFSFVLYGWVIILIKKEKISLKDFWKIVGVLTTILVFSYPAFSYDFFNYMFTAKTVLVYHKNPYEVIPLQFSGVEPWLTFMRWTHLPSAYTPLWILLTLPAYLFGFGYFLFILLNIKLLIGGFYLLTIWGIGKILESLNPDNKLLGMSIFAFNPLIIIESLVSSHNDIVMMGIAMVAIVLYLKKKPMLSFFALAISIGLKLMTIFLVPVHFLKWNRWYALFAITIGFILVCSQREVLPWYWVWVMPFVALLPEALGITIIASGVSLGLLLRYAPYLYYGNYDDPVPTLKGWGTWVPIIASILVVGILRIWHKRFLKKEFRAV